MSRSTDGFDALMTALANGKVSATPLCLDGLASQKRGSPDDLRETVIRIDYADSNGNSSARWVTIRNIDESDPPKLECYCWARRQMRTFRVDRVLEISDMDGETWPARKFFAKFGISVKARKRAPTPTLEPVPGKCAAIHTEKKKRRNGEPLPE